MVESSYTVPEDQTQRLARRTYRRKPDVEGLMRVAGVTWGMEAGRRVLNIPSRATREQVKAIYEALQK